ncbi:hypothetical protein DPMN_124890 [Dreissena polymorpha]|uniref:Uncharacterized protein n=1 Tax=Dreissena polymorpha TaxID=45954 RepID=A0A9D4GUD4_DREPO|nr:hypothetical protein DPMN_124890 [Dreissena polymorpha]
MGLTPDSLFVASCKNVHNVIAANESPDQPALFGALIRSYPIYLRVTHGFVVSLADMVAPEETAQMRFRNSHGLTKDPFFQMTRNPLRIEGVKQLYCFRFAVLLRNLVSFVDGEDGRIWRYTHLCMICFKNCPRPQCYWKTGLVRNVRMNIQVYTNVKGDTSAWGFLIV